MGSGYTNLFTHVQQDHPEYLSIFNRVAVDERLSLLRHFKPKKGRVIFGWIELVILGLRPFSTVEDKVLRRYCRLDPICRDTFHLYMEKLVKVVEGKI